MFYALARQIDNFARIPIAIGRIGVIAEIDELQLGKTADECTENGEAAMA